MKLHSIAFALIAGFSSIAFCQWQNGQTDCQQKILEAETNRQEDIYHECGLKDERMAFETWASWAIENKAYQALYEISKAFPENEQSEELFQIAVTGNNGPALIQRGDMFYRAQNYPQAIAHYTKALNSPLLTLEEKGHITENIGLLYLNPSSSYYDAKKGVPLITKATEQRSSLANNIMGVYSLFGLEGTETNEKESFFYFWRAILLGCPVAQENLGIYHLLHQKKITKKEAFNEMKNHIFSCAPSVVTPQTKATNTEIQKNPNCDCAQVNLRLQLINDNAEYQFISNNNGQPILKNKMGQTFTAKVGLALPDGSDVKEIRATAVILTKGGQQTIVYLLPDQECVRFCQMSSKMLQPQKVEPKKNIQAYHITFTPQECSDILYYAEQLVDPNLPFTGKEECGYSGNLQLANQLLMQE